MTRDELISALTKATGADRDIDAALHALINGGYVEAATRPSNRASIWHKDRGTEPALISGFPNQTRELLCYADHAPHYTGSRDAMIPGAENLIWEIDGCSKRNTTGTDPENASYWCVWAFKNIEGGDFDPSNPIGEGGAATEPLARRIAELKALVPA